jgi:hypothetical protein
MQPILRSADESMWFIGEEARQEKRLHSAATRRAEQKRGDFRVARRRR